MSSRIKTTLIFVIFAAQLFWNRSTNANDITSLQWVSANFSPYCADTRNPQKGNKSAGYICETLLVLQDRLAVQSGVKIFPWARAQRNTQTNTNHLIAPLTRTPKRENLYRWITKIGVYQTVLVSLKPFETTLDQIDRSTSIIANKNTPLFNLVKKLKFTDIIHTSTFESQFKMLLHGRAKLLVAGKPRVQYMQKTSFPETTLHFSNPFKEDYFWLAGSKGLSDKVINHIAQTYEHLVKEGIPQKIHEKYLGHDRPSD